MPQLMPFYWMNTVLMIFFIMISLLFLFFYKKMEMMNKLQYNESGNKVFLNFSIMW